MEFLWIGAAVFLVFLFQEILYSKSWDKGLTAQLLFAQAALREGEQGELKEVVENRKQMPLPVLHVNLQIDRSFLFFNQENTAVSDQAYRRDVFSVLPYQQITRTLPFIAARRGYYRCREVELVGRTLFFQGPYVKKLSQQAALYVYPKPISMEPVKAACQEMLGEYLWDRRLFEDPFSFQGIRDYGPGDSFRQVNWKAYGKTGQLKVNVYEHTAMAKADILLNLCGDSIWTEEALLENVIRIGAALAEQWIALGIPAGIRTNGPDVISGQLVTVGAGAGNAHMKTILQALSRIDLSQMGREGGRRRDESSLWLDGWDSGAPGGMIVYVACSRRKEDLQQIEALRQRGSQVLWICPVTQRILEETSRETKCQNQLGTEPGCVYRGPVMKWRVEE